MEDTLTIIPAKSRSTRLPGKNVVEFLGKPLLVHAVDQAQASGVCGEICVATDDAATAELAKQAGASVPFLRTNDVDDVTPVGVAAKNVLVRYREELGREFRYICLLLATSPLRAAEDIIACREVLNKDPNLDAAMSFVHSTKHPYWAWKFEDDTHIAPMFPKHCDLGRDEAPPAYFVDGSVYWAKADFFESVNGDQYRGRVGGYVLPRERAVDIDTAQDLQFAEFIAKQQS